MPELPEVETTRRGIAPHVVGRTVAAVDVRQRRLRWPIPDGLERALTGRTVAAVERRAKYLLLRTDAGTAILHLGMSGSLRLADPRSPLKKHDHVILTLWPAAGADARRHAGDAVRDRDSAATAVLRYHDPRRFGALLWTEEPPERHPLLAALGPEPLSDAFDVDYLYPLTRGRRTPVKPFVMDGSIVVGVGNIYASEALFLAGIRPQRPVGGIARVRLARLVGAIKQVLADAIRQGGTTLRDFVNGDGEPGYFSQSLHVYGRAGEPCRRCGAAVRALRLGQRSTFYCPRCQR